VTDERKLPKGRVGRLARMAALGARTGASLVLSKNGEGAAKQAAEVLGTLRGLAAKVGQMASYVDGFVPEQHRQAYESALTKLRNAAPTSSPEEVKSTIESELGAPIDRLFAEWEETPFASASIGQVHRARLEDGREVAVKVQHSGIQSAVESDLANAGILESMVRTLGPKNTGSKQTLAEISARFREELDYRHEAEQQRWFQQFHADDPYVHIPAVILERSGRRVITSELVSGLTLEEAAAGGESERVAWATTLWRFVFRGNLVGGRFNADPHPGNYFFAPNGHVTFIDFGCVQPIPPENQRAARRIHLAAIRGDEAEFEQAARALLGLKGGSYEEFALGYTRACFEPLFASPFHLTREYVTKLVSDIGEAKKQVLKKHARFVPLPPGMALMNRLQFGFYSVLSRLDVAVDYREIEREFLAHAGMV
jgi:predicted unusual protein kinase regulating ubiquinone biosynthesis (AarF/ABC1/UbiB family)